MKKEMPACPVETTLMLISDRWKVLIIRDLLDGTKRFGELKRSVGNISHANQFSEMTFKIAEGLSRKVCKFLC